MTNYVADKVIIITGAASGFGKLTSEMAAELGGKTICADINEHVKDVVAGIQAKGGKAEFILTDVTDKDQVDRMAKFAVDTYGRIDVLVNNAGIMPLSFFSDHNMAWKTWDQCIDINLKGVLYGISAVYDQMIRQGQGQIINLSSVFGNYPVAGGGVYAATKAAVRFLSETLRAESQGKIKVTTVRPSGVPNTGLRETILNPAATTGMKKAFQFPNSSGEAPPEYQDIENIKYLSLDPVSLSKNIIYCINQPWGVSIGDITVRASGEQVMI